MRYDVFKGDISAAEVPMIYQPQESLSESSFFRGTESWLLFKGTSAKGVPRLRYDSNCLWHLLAQSGSVFQISINLPLAVVLLQLLLQRNGRFNDHWISLVFKLRRVGHFGGLSDRKNNLINQNTKNAILS